ncbi:hypothetical protein AVEN_269309-1 [Araneus ventricosus]|uniref:Uncharacterized protein n=1 Tax=Araneus ventricosus TaxID=182803 RepID=A0A4Y2I2X9_ARAVE|nr:hypothetical protein AVEN_269309-1 [Araneus ventricosus]
MFHRKDIKPSKPFDQGGVKVTASCLGWTRASTPLSSAPNTPGGWQIKVPLGPPRIELSGDDYRCEWKHSCLLPREMIENPPYLLAVTLLEKRKDSY